MPPGYSDGCSDFGVGRSGRGCRGSGRTFDARILGNLHIFAPYCVANRFGALGRVLADQHFFLDPRGLGNDCLFAVSVISTTFSAKSAPVTGRPSDTGGARSRPSIALATAASPLSTSTNTLCATTASAGAIPGPRCSCNPRACCQPPRDVAGTGASGHAGRCQG
jgi:hypothetical protein